MSQLPASATYVIVGAGVHGLSTAWHLAMELGSGGDIVLIDKTAPGAGATGIACGCVRNFYMTEPVHALVRESVDVWNYDPVLFGFQQVGYISCGEENQIAEYEKIHKSQNSVGYTSDLYVGKEARDFLSSIWPDFKHHTIEVAIHTEFIPFWPESIPKEYTVTVRLLNDEIVEKVSIHEVEILIFSDWDSQSLEFSKVATAVHLKPNDELLAANDSFSYTERRGTFGEVDRVVVDQAFDGDLAVQLADRLDLPRPGPAHADDCNLEHLAGSPRWSRRGRAEARRSRTRVRRRFLPPPGFQARLSTSGRLQTGF